MDSKTLLDYALFQLTPTRTRCDLVIFGGKKKEKIASGLLEPFVSHLKSAKDQISKGGYSFTLQPEPGPASSYASSCPWFTKATLERFVRFVSTPEILERFLSIEREINQIESSIDSNDQINGTVDLQGNAGDPKTPFVPSKSKVESNDAESEENPKIRLQRVLESRKAMLKKEQAMAYARALVAGFEMDYLYDLVSFSDAFGAQRLREACTDFMVLCNTKNDDKIWMDEVAAMQASYLGTPGIMLAVEHNDPPKSPASDSITRHASMDTSEGTENGMPMEFNQQQTQGAGAAQLPTWPNNFPHFMQNSRAPIFQPHLGYIFPGMQVGPSHYQGNMPWADTNLLDSRTPLNRDIIDSDHRDNKSRQKKEKHTKNGESIESDHYSSSRSSSSDDDRINNKKHNKNPLRKVVIRNINYIASDRNENSNSSDEDEYVDDTDYSLFGSLKRHHKPNSNKSKIRERDGSSTKASNKSKNDLDAENEKKDGNWDIFQNLLMRDSASNSTDTGSKSTQVQEEYSSHQKAYREDNMSSLDKKLIHTSDDFLFTEVKFEGGEKAHFSTEPSIVKTRKDEDWIIGSKSEILMNPGENNIDHNIFSGDQAHIPIRENKKDVLLDDSFMVQSRTPHGPPQTQPNDDIFMVTDIVGANDQSKNNAQASSFYEPEDLKMMLGHDSAAEQAVASWSRDMDYGNDILAVETVGSWIKAEQSDSVDTTQLRKGKASKTGASKESGRKVDGKESNSKAPSGSLGRTKSDIPSRSKISTAGSTMVVRSKSDKEEEKRKRMEEVSIHRQKRIAERSAAKVVTPETSKRSSKESKENNNSVSTKAKFQAQTDENKKQHKPVMRISTIDRLAAARTTKMPISTEPKVGQNKKPTPKGNSVTPISSLKKTKGTREQKKDKVNPSDKKNGTNNSKISSENSEKTRVKNGIIEDIGTVKVLHTVSSFEKRESNTLSVQDDSVVDKNSVQVLSDKGLHSLEDINVNDQVGLTPQITVSPMEGNDLKSNVDKKGGEKKRLTFSPEISVVNISTDEMTNEELIHSRKKWNNGESSPKIPKGFRRLLLFGRRTS